MSVRDTQRQKLYNWETRELKKLDPNISNALTLAECEVIIHKVCRDYGITTPRIADGRRCRRALAYADYKIALPRWSRMLWVCLHEVSHTIHHCRRNSGDEAAHGPEFLRIYFDLLVKYAKLPARELRKTITEAKLKIAETSAVPQPRDSEEKRLQKRRQEILQRLTAARQELNKVDSEILAYSRQKALRK